MLLSFSLGSESWISLWEIRALFEAKETMEATLCRTNKEVQIYNTFLIQNVYYCLNLQQKTHYNWKVYGNDQISNVIL